MDPGANPPYREEVEVYLAGLAEVLADEVIVGVYLTGSATLGDYRHGVSDLDPLVLTARPLADEELSGLDALHARLERGRQPHLDAVYLPLDHRGALPAADAAGTGCVVDGVFRRDPGDQALVLWANLAQCGITLCGTTAANLDVAPDPEVFRDWNRGNLASYWKPQADALRSWLADARQDTVVPAEHAVWTGTGPARLHHTIRTGRLISKSSAADWAAELFPEYSDLLSRVKATRRGDGTPTYSRADGLALADLLDRVCDSA